MNQVRALVFYRNHFPDSHIHNHCIIFISFLIFYHEIHFTFSFYGWYFDTEC